MCDLITRQTNRNSTPSGAVVRTFVPVRKRENNKKMNICPGLLECPRCTEKIKRNSINHNRAAFIWTTLENRCLVHCTCAGYVSRHTRTRARSLKQTNKQIDRRPPSCGKGCQMASLVVVSEDETGKAPSVGLREIILVCTDLPTKQLITAGQEEQGARWKVAQLPFQEMKSVKIKVFWTGFIFKRFFLRASY